MKIWIVCVLAACGAKEAPPSSAGSSAPGSGSQAKSVEAPPKPAVAKFPDIPLDRALILADKPGGKVALTLADGAKSELADGTMIDYSSAGATRDPQDDPTQITSNGKTGHVELEHVIGSGAVHPAPSGMFAVLTPFLGCGDYCHQAVWLVEGITGGRWRISDNTVNPQVAWRADGKAVAVDGGDGVAVIELPSGKQLAKLDNTYSPTYAPNGTLYVRGHEHEVFEVTGDKTKKVGQGKKPGGGPYPLPPFPVKIDASGNWQLDDDEKPTKTK